MIEHKKFEDMHLSSSLSWDVWDEDSTPDEAHEFFSDWEDVAAAQWAKWHDKKSDHDIARRQEGACFIRRHGTTDTPVKYLIFCEMTPTYSASIDRNNP